MGQLSLWTAITKAHTPRVCASQQEKPPQEKPRHRDKEQALLTAPRESLQADTKTQHSQK